jgi:hypothetical protein
MPGYAQDGPDTGSSLKNIRYLTERIRILVFPLAFFVVALALSDVPALAGR